MDLDYESFKYGKFVPKGYYILCKEIAKLKKMTIPSFALDEVEAFSFPGWWNKFPMSTFFFKLKQKAVMMTRFFFSFVVLKKFLFDIYSEAYIV